MSLQTKEDLARRRLAGAVKDVLLEIERSGASYRDARVAIVNALGRLAGDVTGHLAAMSGNPDLEIERVLYQHSRKTELRARDELTACLLQLQRHRVRARAGRS